MNHPNLSDEINRQISESEGNGFFLRDIEIGKVLTVRTLNSVYKLENMGDGIVRIEGGKLFPGKRLAHLNGSTWGGSMIKVGWVGPGMHMELLYHGEAHRTITSEIQSVSCE